MKHHEPGALVITDKVQTILNGIDELLSSKGGVEVTGVRGMEEDDPGTIVLKGFLMVWVWRRTIWLLEVVILLVVHLECIGSDHCLILSEDGRVEPLEILVRKKRQLMGRLKGIDRALQSHYSDRLAELENQLKAE
ncbi:hypothetical protein V6N13_059685 [Hibiscus sabdariffa]